MTSSRLHRTERLWPDPDTGPYRLHLWFGFIDGRPGVVGVEMWGVDPQRSDWATLPEALPETVIGADDIRLKLGEQLDRWVALTLSRAQRASERTARELTGRDVKVVITDAPERRRPGRRPLPDEFLQKVSEDYVAAVKRGVRDPSAEVGRLNGAANSNTARGWVRQARNRGFLAKPVSTSTRRKR